MVTTSKRFEFPKAILSEKPLLDVFNNVQKSEYMLIMLFATAFYNRVARKSAIAIEKELQLSNSINSQCVRYLLLLYFMTVITNRKVKAIQTHILERADLYKRDKTRLTSMLRLHETGLTIFTKKSERTNTLEITDLGIKAIKIVSEQLTELIHLHPKPHFSSNKPPKNGTKQYCV